MRPDLIGMKGGAVFVQPRASDDLDPAPNTSENGVLPVALSDYNVDNDSRPKTDVFTYRRGPNLPVKNDRAVKTPWRGIRACDCKYVMRHSRRRSENLGGKNLRKHTRHGYVTVWLHRNRRAVEAGGGATRATDAAPGLTTSVRDDHRHYVLGTALGRRSPFACNSV